VRQWKHKLDRLIDYLVASQIHNERHPKIYNETQTVAPPSALLPNPMSGLASPKKTSISIGFFSTVLTILSVAVFDSFLASNSVIPLRYVYDLSFALIMGPTSYVSILLLKNKQIPKRETSINFPKFLFILPILVNLEAILSTLSLDIPDIGLLDSNFLVQGANSLLPLFNYLLIAVTNGAILCFVVNKKIEMYAYELPTFALGAVAIEVLLSEYGFQLGSVTGIRVSLVLFFVGMSAVFALQCLRLRAVEIRIKFETSDKLLLLLSAGMLMMFFVPYGIYNLMGDNAVITNSALSISWRGSLQPYYASTGYYTSIGGFVAVIAAYSCNLNNILLASNLPFLASYVLIPFIVYHFLRKYFVSDLRIAIVGAVAAILMDGLAVLLLPAYKDNLTMNAINGSISPATESLYFSTTCWLWLTPYKTFSIASAVATSSVLEKSKGSTLLLSGALLALSFTNPRQPFLAILLLLLLLGIRRLNMKNLFIIGLSAILSSGPLFLATFYKMTKAVFYSLNSLGVVSYETTTKFSEIFIDTATNPLPQTAVIALVLTLLILNLRSNRGYEAKESEIPVQSKPPKKERMIRFEFRKTERVHILKNETIMFWGLCIVVLSYVVLYANGMLPALFIGVDQNIAIATLNYLVLRYHILIVLAVLGFFYFAARAHTLKMIVILSIVVIATYLGTALGLYAPLVVVAIALPVLSVLVKTRKRLKTCAVLFIVVLGIFSATFYSATVKSVELEQPYYYDDLPYVIRTLIAKSPDTAVYSPSSYDYFVARTVSMAQLRLTTDQSSPIYIIDVQYTDPAIIEDLLRNSKTEVLYQGKSLIVLERKP
jgi:hypothetical protein